MNRTIRIVTIVAIGGAIGAVTRAHQATRAQTTGAHPARDAGCERAVAPRGFFRAFDARNGTVLWRDKLPEPAHGTPTTYLGRDGKQYVVVGANGGSYIRSPGGDAVISYTIQ